DQNKKERADQEGKLGVEIQNLLMMLVANLRKQIRRWNQRAASTGQIGERQSESQHGEQSASAEALGSRIQQQHHGEREHLPELLLGKIGEESRPAESDQERHAQGNRHLRKE